MITVTEYESLGKGKLRVRFDNEAELILYRGEAKQWKLREEAEISEEDYQKLLTEVVGKRAKKRAMHLLECMDRTEKQLRDKLEDGKYPQVCIDEAIAYVRKYHYIDDYRYACTFIRYSQEKMSRLQLKMKLTQKGVPRDVIEKALELGGYSEDKAFTGINGGSTVMTGFCQRKRTNVNFSGLTNIYCAEGFEVAIF